MSRGGARPRSGPAKGTKYKPRKVRPKGSNSPSEIVVPEPVAPEVQPRKKFETPLDFLRAVYNREVIATEEQVEAAKAALPYEHPKLLTVKATSREQALEKAKALTSSGRFQPMKPPKLLVDNTRPTNGKSGGEHGD